MDLNQKLVIASQINSVLDDGFNSVANRMDTTTNEQVVYGAIRVDTALPKSNGENSVMTSASTSKYDLMLANYSILCIIQK
ncbi:hypothetical protein [Deinococcus sp. QL22]|uniref:hypothetical protein n=1 Tax=Deinococcus sp. QL22 TaxID=2939437 RepID=UPI002017BDA0|nr:hypothetical protein [Deinococcus sp. QL22]UQN10595.1 hypothetical protein M1R55_30845 [Deinococcus sp. QL22]